MVSIFSRVDGDIVEQFLVDSGRATDVIVCVIKSIQGMKNFRFAPKIPKEFLYTILQGGLVKKCNVFM